MRGTGRYVGTLQCLPTDCGPTLDQQPVETSAFGKCVNGTTLNSRCETRCGDGFYAESGSGVATFACEDTVYGGMWLEQGHPFYESSLQCAKCPTIENCRVSSCATGTDAVCSECEAGYYSFRHDEDSTRCIAAATVTMTAASFTAGATGIYVFVVPAGTTLVAGNGGVMEVAASASLAVQGADASSSLLDVDSMSIEGNVVISGIHVDESIGVTDGGSLTLQSVGGTISSLAADEASTVSVDAATFSASQFTGKQCLRWRDGQLLVVCVSACLMNAVRSQGFSSCGALGRSSSARPPAPARTSAAACS